MRLFAWSATTNLSSLSSARPLLPLASRNNAGKWPADQLEDALAGLGVGKVDVPVLAIQTGPSRNTNLFAGGGAVGGAVISVAVPQVGVPYVAPGAQTARAELPPCTVPVPPAVPAAPAVPGLPEPPAVPPVPGLAVWPAAPPVAGLTGWPAAPPVPAGAPPVLIVPPVPLSAPPVPPFPGVDEEHEETRTSANPAASGSRRKRRAAKRPRCTMVNGIDSSHNTGEIEARVIFWSSRKSSV